MRATPEELHIHNLLIEGDQTAPAVVAEYCLTRLINKLERAFPYIDKSLVWDVASDALLEYVENPVVYEPHRRTLVGYLYMVARGDLLNELQKRARVRRHEKIEDPVELGHIGGNTIERGNAPDQELLDQELEGRIEVLLRDPLEREVLLLMMEGERDHEVFAKAMKIEHLSVEEQRIIVKRMKDKLKIRLRRAGRDEFL